MPIVDQWDVQEVIKQIVAELKRRKYLVWFDCKCHAPMPARDLSALTFASHGAVFNMKGSVMVRTVEYCTIMLACAVLTGCSVCIFAGCHVGGR